MVFELFQLHIISNVCWGEGGRGAGAACVTVCGRFSWLITPRENRCRKLVVTSFFSLRFSNPSILNDISSCLLSLGGREEEISNDSP